MIWIDGSSGVNSACAMVRLLPTGEHVYSSIVLPSKLGNNRTELEAFLWSTHEVSARPLIVCTDSLYVMKHGVLPRVIVRWTKGHSIWQMHLVDTIAKLTALTKSVYYNITVESDTNEKLNMELRRLRDKNRGRNDQDIAHLGSNGGTAGTVLA